MGDGRILIGKAIFNYSRERKYSINKEAQVNMLAELKHSILIINQRYLIRLTKYSSLAAYCFIDFMEEVI